VPLAETEQAATKLDELRQRLSEAQTLAVAARDEYHEQLQRVALSPPAYFESAVLRTEQRVRQLEAAVTAAQQERDQAEATARLVAARAALPEYRNLVSRLADALKQLRSARSAIQSFRNDMETEDKWAPQILEGIDGILGEFADSDRLNGAIAQLESIAGQNGNSK
jgi:chromosome segregation ATPase